MKLIFTWASVVVGFVAAALWFLATVVWIHHERHVQRLRKKGLLKEGEAPAAITDGNLDILETIKVQSLWNRWAAAATALAVGLQAIATAIPPT